MKEVQPDSVAKRYYAAIKHYQLPVMNHGHIKTRIAKLETEVGREHALYYLTALVRRDLRTEPGDYRPTLNTGLDIYNKRLKIEDYYRANAPKRAWHAPTPEEAEAAELERNQQWDK